MSFPEMAVADSWLNFFTFVFIPSKKKRLINV